MKKRKLFSCGIFALLLSLMFSLNVFAASKYYLSVGTNFGSIGGNSTPEANYVGGTLSLSNYIGRTVIAPQYASFNSTYQGRYALESDVLYFLGHADSQKILFNYQARNGSYAVGITNRASDTTSGIYNLTGIGRYNLGKVKLAVFQGCSTAADSNNNIAKYANSRGAGVTIGWAQDINRSDSLPWIKKFFSNGAFPNTVTNMVNYANSFGYVTTAIKNTRVYGNGGSSIYPVSINQASQMSNFVTDSRKHKVNITFDTNVQLSAVETKIAEIIKNNIDTSFDENDYIFEMAENNYGKIYDLYYTINGVKTSIGYTVFTNVDGTMIADIYDNMNNYNGTVLKSKKTKDIKAKLDRYTISKKSVMNNQALSLASADVSKDSSTTIDSSFDYYDVAENKLYHITLVKVELSSGAHSILDYKQEL